MKANSRQSSPFFAISLKNQSPSCFSPKPSTLKAKGLKNQNNFSQEQPVQCSLLRIEELNHERIEKLNALLLIFSSAGSNIWCDSIVITEREKEVNTKFEANMDVLASGAVHLLLGKIVSALQNEASLLLGGVHDELEDLKQELVSMKSFLEDAERKKPQWEGEKTWVASVKDKAFEVEDIIDEFTYHMNRQRSRGRLSQFFYQPIHKPRNLWLTQKTASKVRKIKQSIKDIAERSKRYGVNRIEGATSNDDHKRLLNLRESSRFIQEDNLVEVKEENEVMKWLMDKEPHQTIISVVGMGGSGKTTLVGKMYKNESVNCHFDCYAWITVSQTYEINDLLKRLIKEFNAKAKVIPVDDLNAMDFSNLVEKLITYLKLKRYLVVLDDVWDINLWMQMESSLPNNQLGSRVMLTTRKEDVASFSSGGRGCILHIEPIDENQAWALFCMKAFSSHPNNTCPRDLEPLAQELLKKCEGLPLAIVTLGGVMSSKKQKVEWDEICMNLNHQLNDNPQLDVVKNILLLSFNDLPYPLKHCFLYCCLFPEDYLIKRRKLIRLWMAEGFIHEVNRNITAEELAERYLRELIFRSMLHVVKRNEFGRPTTCKMHDLMRELALLASKREKFCAVYNAQVAIEECGARHLSIQTTESDLKPYSGMSRLRSFFLFASGSLTFPNTFLSKFKLIRVLDLEGAPIDNLPNELMILFNLRYLNLRETKLKELPKSIGRLSNLQTLDIENTLIEELPQGVVKLQNLQYLTTACVDYGNIIDFPVRCSARAPFKISKLKKLQILYDVEAEGDTIKQLGRMTQLTVLGITNVREVDEMDLCSSIVNLKLLKTLSVQVADEEEFLPMDPLSSPPPHLRRQYLSGKLVRVPHWFCSLQCLQTLWLHWSRIREDLLPHIAALPNLALLCLVNAFVGEKLHFRSGFAKLTILKLWNFPGLTEIIIEKGVMPDIRELYLWFCMELDALPQGIEHLTNLQELNLRSVSMDLVNSIRGEESTCHLKVRHIPIINHYYQAPNGFVSERLS